MKYQASYKLYMFMAVVIIGCTLGFSQTNTAQWTAESYMVNINGTDVAINSELKVDNNIFSWKQTTDQIDKTMDFSITDTSDNWDTQQQLGSITYTLTIYNTNASLTLNATNDEAIVAVLVFYDNNGQATNTHQFEIESMTNL